MAEQNDLQGALSGLLNDVTKMFSDAFANSEAVVSGNKKQTNSQGGNEMDILARLEELYRKLTPDLIERLLEPVVSIIKRVLEMVINFVKMILTPLQGLSGLFGN